MSERPHPRRKPNEGADYSKWENAAQVSKDEQEDLIAASKQRTSRSKQKKEKTIIEADQ